MQISLILSAEEQPRCRQAFAAAARIAHTGLAVLGTAFQLGLAAGRRVSSLLSSPSPSTIYRGCSSASLPNLLGVSDRAPGARLPLPALPGPLQTRPRPQLRVRLTETRPSPG